MPDETSAQTTTPFDDFCDLMDLFIFQIDDDSTREALEAALRRMESQQIVKEGSDV